MTTRIIVPHLDANIIDVTVTAWNHAPGDTVVAGDIIAVLTTDKAAFELEAPASGVLLQILAAPKSVVPSGYILGIIGASGESDAAAETVNSAIMAAYRETAGGGARRPSPAALTPAAGATRVRATPRARRLAQQQGIDLAAVQAATGAEIVDEAALQKYQGR